jgi:hypothetical protein
MLFSQNNIAAYQLMSTVMPESRWGLLAVSISLLRIIGLWINGWWRRTPILRLVGSLLSAMMWAAIAGMMWTAAAATGAALPGGFVWYAVFLAGEVVCCLATGYDMHRLGSLSAGVPRKHVTR